MEQSRRNRTKGTTSDPSSRRAWPLKVLLASDGSSHSDRAAKLLAGMLTPEAVVRIITVAGLEFAPYDDKWGPLSDEPERQAMLKSVSEASFAKPVEYLSAAGCRVETITRLGNPAEQILFEIASAKPDLVVVGRAGMTRLQRLLMGSVSEHLVKHSPVPILIVP